MPVASKTRLGPYEIIAAIGAGGMGEVYRARDNRLARDVAVKLLPAAFAADPDRLRRFEQEARASAALNHPNILAVYDVGTIEGVPYVVSELLEGETLRERLRSGPLPARKAIEMAVQIANGLAAAHERGVIHRDLKPENLFILRDGRIKILDFGLAKLTQPESDSRHTAPPTMETGTDPGTVLGTMGYMSPEQVRGRPADARSDIFSFGAILYEMLSGKRAFHGATAADTISAILKEDPPDLVETNRSISPALERIVRHCLEKNPEQRFHSASDIAFDLEALSATSSTSAVKITQAATRLRLRAALLVLAAIVGVALAFLAGRTIGPSSSNVAPDIHQLTFRRGTVRSARFAADGQTAIYSAAWEGKPEEVFSTSAQNPESRPLDLHDAELVSLSSTGQMALKLNPRVAGNFPRPGILAAMPLTGGAPRALLDNVEAADWSPDGEKLAVVQLVNGQSSLQYPVGKVLFQARNWISHARVSPSGDSIAFLNHPFGGDEGSVMLVDTAGNARTLTTDWLSVQGLAWSPDGKEIWFTGTRFGSNRSLYAVSRNGRERLVSRVPATMTLQDISLQGHVLLTSAYDRLLVMALLPGEKAERDLSWFDAGLPVALSADGKVLLLSEVGEGGGEHYSVYLRPTDGSPAIRLGEGNACDLSPDGKFALAWRLGNRSKLFLLPLVGAPRELSIGDLEPSCGRILPGGHKIIFFAREPGRQGRMYSMDLENGGSPKPFTPEGVYRGRLITSDGKLIVRAADGQNWMAYPIESGAPLLLRGIEPGEEVVGIGRDDRTLYVRRLAQLPQKIGRVDSVTGQRQFWKEIAPVDTAGVENLGSVTVYNDGKAYIYNYNRILSDLYLIKGLK